MTSLSSKLQLAQCAVQVSPRDNVAVVKNGLAGGELDYRLPNLRTHVRELHQLSDAFNAMASAVANHLDLQACRQGIGHRDTDAV